MRRRRDFNYRSVLTGIFVGLFVAAVLSIIIALTAIYLPAVVSFLGGVGLIASIFTGGSGATLGAATLYTTGVIFMASFAGLASSLIGFYAGYRHSCDSANSWGSVQNASGARVSEVNKAGTTSSRVDIYNTLRKSEALTQQGQSSPSPRSKIRSETSLFADNQTVTQATVTPTVGEDQSNSQFLPRISAS